MAVTTQKYQIKIGLQEAKPPIWRRIFVPSNMNLSELHEVIQVTMGWENYHLHQFFINGRCYGPITPDLDDMEWDDEQDVTLSSAFPKEKSKIVYEYDFGDGWVHDITLEKVLPLNKKDKLPTCIKGKRACPPEDCGGIWGYANLLDILADPKHEEYEDTLEWIGKNIDPEAFSVEAINERYQHML